jgi:hypothetical protein
MIDMNCPACGAEGRAPNDKINTRLVCRKCLKVFYLTPTGRAVLGEPPQAAVTPTTKTPREKVEFDFSLDVPPWLRSLTKRVISPKVLAVVGGLIVLAAGYAAVSYLRGESLEERATKVARAAVDGDLGTLLTLTSTDTGDDMVKWYTKVRPQCDELKRALLTPTPFVQLVVNKEDDATGTVEVVAQITNKEPLARTGARIPDATISAFSAEKKIELPLMLTSEGFGGWRLDGKRTLETIPKTP